MTANQLRKKFIDFLVTHGHKIIKSSSLIPENDPTVLFTTAGMHPLVPFLLGEHHPAGIRLVNIQKCIRTNDIEEVGDDIHNTFFEMLGYWSLGDYWKKESIHITFDFYTKIIGFKKQNIHVTVFGGDQDVPFDKESYNTWEQEIGISKERIHKYSKSENWWGPAGNTGPCGPCTEMFLDTGAKACGTKCAPSCTCGKFVEIGNNVFMEYNKKADGSFEPLVQKNVDVGLGFERILAFTQKKSNIYKTELFIPLIQYLVKNCHNFDEKGARIISDHIKASAFIIADGIIPSNIDQGYILRRLLRRIIRYANLMEIKNNTYLDDLIDIIIKIYQDVYPEINQPKLIKDIIAKEAKKFEHALAQGQKEFAKIANNLKNKNIDMISGELIFKLYESYGFPIELTEELAKEENLEVDKDGFIKSFEAHQLLSRAGAEKKFSGGLADNSQIVTGYHTATHLLHAALRKILGEHVMQKGSNITAERMRFDFIHSKPMTPEEIKQVEKLVNQKIKENLPVTVNEMDLKDAKVSGALGFFESKYGKIVKVYTIGKSDCEYFSKEICGGPHVKNTSELGHFKIISEKSSSAGIRRIKAILE